jgi:hypothetical protein
MISPEQLRRFAIRACRAGLRPAARWRPCEQLVEQREIERGAVVQPLSAHVQPLPELGAADLGGGRVFHQVWIGTQPLPSSQAAR